MEKSKQTKRLSEQNKKTSAYAKGFKKRSRDKFVKGQIVAVKELPEHKENEKYGKTGKIVEALENDSYLVKCNDRIEKRNHRDISALP
ncbi:hypothetical protein PAPHI01_2561 [Pancytospora philotis]|nr:hypothetical protein PAPHI01_2561 [Pancytospora philotis]